MIGFPRVTARPASTDTYGLHGRDVIDEVPLRHIQRDLAIGRALLKNFEVVHHLADLVPAGNWLSVAVCDRVCSRQTANVQPRWAYIRDYFVCEASAAVISLA